MTVEASDAELVGAARQGDERAFGRLVERHWGRLVALARSVGGEVEAEDVVQDSLVAAWRRLGALREDGAFLGWSMRIVFRASLRRARRRALWRPLSRLFEPSDPREDSSAGAGAGMVDRLLARLAPRQRAVMHLTVVEEMTDREIGAALGIEPASVRSHRRRARGQLQGMLAGEADGRTSPGVRR